MHWPLEKKVLSFSAFLRVRIFLTFLEDFEAKLCEILVPCTGVPKLKNVRNDHNVSKHFETMLQTTFDHEGAQ